jgi:non-heme chloroperoxidase
MSTITTKDGSQIFFKDWGQGQPIVFCHGWPLNADAWDPQLFFFAAQGYRAIAHDRRGHGRSSQPWQGNDMNTYADDLAELLEQLDLREVVLVGHSTGGGELARCVARHGTKRIARAALISAVPPLMLRTATNTEGTPMAVFDGMRAAIVRDRAQFYRDLSRRFYGANRTGSRVSGSLCEQFWLQSMQVGIKGALDCIKAFSETDFTEDLRQLDVPTLVLHGDEDQIVPIATSGLRSAKLLKQVELEIYTGAPHGLMATHRDRFNVDLLDFISG